MTVRLLLTLGVSGVIALGATQVPLAREQAAATTSAPQAAAGFVQQAGGLTAASARRANEGLGPFKTLTIRGVMLIDGTGAPPTGPVNITVEGNRITRIASAGTPGVQQPAARAARGAAAGGPRSAGRAGRRPYVLEAQGMYLMPGFIDMHVHAGGAPKNAEAEYAYKLWLAHGVTTVRGVRSDQQPHRERKGAQREKRDRRAAHLQLSAARRAGPASPSTRREAREWVRQDASNASMD